MAGVVLDELAEPGEQPVADRLVEGVARLRPVDGEPGDAIGLLEQDGISAPECSTLRLQYQGASVPVG